MSVGYLLVGLAAALWGSIGVIGKGLFQQGLDPLTVSTARAGFTFLAMVALAAGYNRRLLVVEKRDMGFFVLYGLVSVAVYNFAYLSAIQKTTVATAVVLLYTAPAFVAVFSYYFLGEAFTGAKAACLLFTLAGCFLVVKGYDAGALRLNGPGIAAGLGAGLTYALFSIFGKKGLARYHPWTVVLYSQGFGALFLLAASRPWRLFAEGHPPEVWIRLGALALICTVAANSSYIMGLKRLEASRASITATLEPVVAAVLAYLLLGETMEGWQVLGILVVVGAVVMLQRAPSSRRQEAGHNV